MGFAKYYEDNENMREERLYYQSSPELKPLITRKKTIIINNCIIRPSAHPQEKETTAVKRTVISHLKQSQSSAEQPNITLFCKDCGTSFVFTVGEQEFYKKKQFRNPCRCKECRERKQIIMAMSWWRWWKHIYFMKPSIKWNEKEKPSQERKWQRQTA